MQVCGDVASTKGPAVRIMLLFSDGLADDDGNAQAAIDVAINAGVRMFPVLLGHQSAEAVAPTENSSSRATEFRLKRFVEPGRTTGGRGFDPITANSRAVASILDYVARLVAGEYIVGYYAGEPDGRARKRRVEVHLRSKALGKLLGGSRVVIR